MMWHGTGPGLCRPCQDADPSPHWERESKAPPLQLYHCCGCQVLWESTAGCQLMWGFECGGGGGGVVDGVRGVHIQQERTVGGREVEEERK